MSTRTSRAGPGRSVTAGSGPRKRVKLCGSSRAADSRWRLDSEYRAGHGSACADWGACSAARIFVIFASRAADPRVVEDRNWAAGAPVARLDAGRHLSPAAPRCSVQLPAERAPLCAAPGGWEARPSLDVPVKRCGCGGLEWSKLGPTARPL